MRLFIRLQNGQPFEHPIMEDNFRQAFPKVDLNNLPEWVAEFKRIAKPSVGVYEVYEGVSYGFDGPVVKDIYSIRPMTDAEKLAKQNKAKQDWEKTGFVSWIFDEDTCNFNPPTPYPDDGARYCWDEETTSWKEVK